MAKRTIPNRIPLDIVKGTNYFNGIDDLANMNFEVFVNGYAFIYWLDLPTWFKEDPDLENFKEYTEKNFNSFNGVEDIELQTVSQITGFAGNEVAYAGDINQGNNSFNITHKEYSGGITRKMYQKWISYIRDPRAGHSTYSKKFGVEYGSRNHTGQLLYIVVRPSFTATQFQQVEYAALYTNVFPTTIPLGELYNYEKGQQESPTVNISFRGHPEIGPDVEAFAEKVLREKILHSEDNPDGIPFLDAMGTDEDAANALNEGILKEIYNKNNR